MKTVNYFRQQIPVDDAPSPSHTDKAKDSKPTITSRTQQSSFAGFKAGFLT